MRSLLPVAILAGAALTACESATPQPGAAEMALVKQRIAIEMAAPITAMQKQLRRAAKDDIYTSEMQIPSGDGPPLPLDWWLYQRGYVKLAGADQYLQGYFGLTPAGQAFLDGKAHWLTVSFPQAPSTTCAGSKVRGACTVSGTAVLKPGPGAGADGLKGAPLPSQAFTVNLEYGPQGWTATELKLGSGKEPYVAALDALFGDYDTILEQRTAYAEAVNREARKL